MFVTIAFTAQNIIVLSYYQGTRFMTSIEKNGNKDRVFTQEDGLQFAIALMDFKGPNYQDRLGRNFTDYIELKVT